MLKDSEEKIELKKYKYCSVSMVVIYVMITFFDLITDNLSAQSIMIFTVYMCMEGVISFYYEHKLRKLFLSIIMAIIFSFFAYEYIITIISKL